MNIGEFLDKVDHFNISEIDKIKVKEILNSLEKETLESTFFIEQRDDLAYIFIPDELKVGYLDKNLITIWIPKTLKGRVRYESYKNYDKQYITQEESIEVIEKIKNSYRKLKTNPRRVKS
jgi:hypothetical protein